MALNVHLSNIYSTFISAQRVIRGGEERVIHANYLSDFLFHYAGADWKKIQLNQ